MNFRWLVLLLLPLGAHAQQMVFPIEIFEYVDNARVVAFINQSDIDATRNWHPFDEAVPLTVDQATERMNSYMASAPELEGGRLEEIVLRRIPQHEKQWHYMFKMRTDPAQGSQAHYFVMLMSGKIIPAIREPESIK